MSEEKQISIAQYIARESVSNNIKEVLKDKMPQFIASVTSLVNSNKALQEADPKTILLACLTASSLDLPINQNLGFAYIIAYKDHKTGISSAQFQLGYKGFIQLAQRSGQFKTINVTDVREGEITDSNNLTGEIQFEWLKEDREKAKIIGYVAYMKLTNGFEKILYMTTEQLKAHGVKFSKSLKAGYGLWKDEFDVMAKKTVIKLLLSKYAPMTVDMQTAALADQAIVKDDGYEYVDNQFLGHEEISAGKENERVLKHIEASKTLDELRECESALSDETREAFSAKQDALTAEGEGETK